MINYDWTTEDMQAAFDEGLEIGRSCEYANFDKWLYDYSLSKKSKTGYPMYDMTDEEWREKHPPGQSRQSFVTAMEQRTITQMGESWAGVYEDEDNLKHLPQIIECAIKDYINYVIKQKHL